MFISVPLCVLIVVAATAQRSAQLARPVPLAAPPAGSAAQALSLAASTDAPVTVDDATTPWAITQALPDGNLDTTFSAQPVRVERDGSWVPVDAGLKQQPDGSWAPTAALNPVALSNGGPGPLATLHDGDNSMTLSWPTSLPAPQVDGATATYPNVLPGVDLQVDTDSFGGVSELLVVKSAQAAADPSLDAISFVVGGNGSPPTSDSAGDIQVAASSGAPAFQAATPLMWDSTGAAVSPGVGGASFDGVQPTVAGSSDASADPSADSSADDGGPSPQSQVATVDVDTNGNSLTLSPDQSLLSGDNTTYPVYIDPAWEPATKNASAFTWAQEANPTSKWYDTNSNGNPAVGYQGWDPSYQGKNRSFWQYDVSYLGNAQVNSATLEADETYSGSFDCTAAGRRQIDERSTDRITQYTSWNNQPQLFSTKFFCDGRWFDD